MLNLKIKSRLLERLSLIPDCFNKKLSNFTVSRFLAILIVALFHNSALYSQDSLELKSVSIFENCKAGDFIKVAEYFDETIKSKLDAGQLSYLWGSLEERVGKMKPVQSRMISSEVKDSITIYYIPCDFEKLSIDLKLGFNSSGKVIGFFLIPPTGTVSYKRPEWIGPGVIKERDIEIPGTRFKLKGKLTLPAQGTRFPLVILVHGSGPQDMDVTIGPNRIFSDLAMSLAANGVAVLRYHKRTYNHIGDLYSGYDQLTPYEETVEDVRFAYDYAVSLPETDSASVFVLGHSFGGMMSARIAKTVPQLKGLVVMAANASPLENIVISQMKYLFQNDTASGLSGMSIKKAEAAKRIVSAHQYNSNTPADSLLLGLTPAYWDYLKAYDQVEEMKSVNKPVLFVQGGRDYQVPVSEFEIWKKNLAGRGDFNFLLYPELNHLFMKGEGLSLPLEYENRGNVSRQVTDDISKWIFEKSR